MINEFFIDSQLKTAISIFDNNISVSEEIEYFSILKNIIEYELKKLEKINQKQVNQQYIDKLELIKILCDFRLEKGKLYNTIQFLDTLNAGKLKVWIEYLQNIQEFVDKPQFLESLRIVSNKLKIIKIFKNKDKFQKLIDEIDTGEHYTDESIVDTWEKVIFDNYQYLNDLNRFDILRSASSLDLIDDDYNNMVRNIANSLDSDIISKSGFETLDNSLVCGGFEGRRLYLIGGTSGCGKSMLLINLMVNSVKSKNNFKDKPIVLLYISLENLIYETWCRFYCCLTNTPHKTFYNRMKQELNSGEDNYELFSNSLKKQVTDILKKSNSKVILKYLPPTSSVLEIYKLVEETKNKYGYITAVYVDYLDLLSSTKSMNEYRFELGEISKTLKSLAIEYDVPLITVTQLNREGYNSEKGLNLTQMSESMLKVDCSDFVMFMQNIGEICREGNIKYKGIRAKILKQRNGPSGIEFTLGYPLTMNNKFIFDFSIVELSPQEERISDNNILMENIKDIDDNNDIFPF